jgi:hypothetical protein
MFWSGFISVFLLVVVGCCLAHLLLASLLGGCFLWSASDLGCRLVVQSAAAGTENRVQTLNLTCNKQLIDKPPDVLRLEPDS